MTTYYASFIEELKTIRKEVFESKLADQLIKSDILKHSANIVTEQIILVMQNNQPTIINFINDNLAKLDDLYNEDQFGHLDKHGPPNNTATTIFNDMLTKLQDPNTTLDKLMHVHVIFIQKIYSNLIDENVFTKELSYKKAELVKAIFYNELFTPDRRIPLEKKTPLRTRIGIIRNPVWEKRLNMTMHKHVPSLFRFAPNTASYFFQESKAHQLPFISGPSGHTGSFLLGAKLFSDLTGEDLMNYTLACFAYLACGGNHSFHEVMRVANKVGVPFSLKEYIVSFSEKLKQSDFYKELQKEFEDILSPSTSPCCHLA